MIEEQQDDPYPHARADMHEFARELGRIVSPTPDRLNNQQHPESEDVGEDEAENIACSHMVYPSSVMAHYMLAVELSSGLSVLGHMEVSDVKIYFVIKLK